MACCVWMMLTSGVISAASLISFQQDLPQDHTRLLQKHFYGGKRSEHFWVPHLDVIAVDSSLFDVWNAEVNLKSFFFILLNLHLTFNE